MIIQTGLRPKLIPHSSTYWRTIPKRIISIQLKMKFKNLFLFDKEQISSSQFVLRFIIGVCLTPVFGSGLWVLAAAGYKRAGTLNWKNVPKILSALFIPIFGLEKSNNIFFEIDEISHFYDITDISVIGSVFFLILLLSRDKNKKPPKLHDEDRKDRNT